MDTPHDDRATQLVRAGLWLLPVYGVLLALGTLTHQPDYTTDFPGYASYVVTDRFLLSHLLTSILGGALGAVGAVCAAAYLTQGPAPVRGLVGAALVLVGNTVVTAVFGVAAFAQPAIGRAWSNGDRAVVDLNDDVYGAPLVVTVSLGLLALVAGAVLLGSAVRRTGGGGLLTYAGTGLGAGMVVFVLAGFSVQLAQPLSALLVAAAGVLVAWRLPDAVVHHPNSRGALTTHR